MFEIGKVYHFTYRCWEDEQSQDAELWYHTNQDVFIVQRLTDVDEDDVGRMYCVQFADGFRYVVFEDELAATQQT